MSTWEYRAIRYKLLKGEYWQVAEYHGKKYGCAHPMEPYGDTKEELIQDLERMLEDVKNNPTIIIEVEE